MGHHYWGSNYFHHHLCRNQLFGAVIVAENSKIEWTDHTFNPWIGCTKVSTGCKNCYAETWSKWRSNKWADTWGPQGTRLRTSDANWHKPLIWNTKAEAIEEALGEWFRYRVFCGSLCDVFEDKHTWDNDLHKWRLDLWDLIHLTGNLTWLLLTKRPELVSVMIPSHWHFDWPDNVWIGTSVESQEQADKRIPELLKIPAAIRFLSMEPLLGPISIFGWTQNPSLAARLLQDQPMIDWVIVGGESGPNRRPMDLEWARSIRDQCQIASVPFFMKQIDKVQPIPPDLMIREFPQ